MSGQQEYRAKTRLYLEQDLTAGATIALDQKAAHYLENVLRMAVDAHVFLFNGRDGEWIGKYLGDKSMAVIRQTRAQIRTLDLCLIFSPVKKDGTDFILEKSTELSVARLMPVFTDHANTDRFNIERARAHVIAASAQSGRLDIPHVSDAQKLDALLNAWPHDHGIVFCDEMRDSDGIADVLARADHGKPLAFLIGPEGGFSARERALLQSKPFVKSAHLGANILRAETACVAALSAWHAVCGSWKNRI